MCLYKEKMLLFVTWEKSGIQGQYPAGALGYLPPIAISSSVHRLGREVNGNHEKLSAVMTGISKHALPQCMYKSQNFMFFDRYITKTLPEVTGLKD